MHMLDTVFLTAFCAIVVSLALGHFVDKKAG
jgi:hypothetical protein